jgi:hypothetical protein
MSVKTKVTVPVGRVSGGLPSLIVCELMSGRP